MPGYVGVENWLVPIYVFPLLTGDDDRKDTCLLLDPETGSYETNMSSKLQKHQSTFTSSQL